MKKIAIIGGGISGLYFANLLNNQKNKMVGLINKKVVLHELNEVIIKDKK